MYPPHERKGRKGKDGNGGGRVYEAVGRSAGLHSWLKGLFLPSANMENGKAAGGSGNLGCVVSKSE